MTKFLGLELENDELLMLTVFAPLAIYGAFNRQPPAWLNAIGAGLTVWQMTLLVRKGLGTDPQSTQGEIAGGTGNRFYLPGKTLAELLS